MKERHRLLGEKGTSARRYLNVHDLRACPGYPAGEESMDPACGDLPAERWGTFFSQSGFKRLAERSVNSLCTEAAIIAHVESRLNTINQIKSEREATPFRWHHRRGRVLDQDGSWFLSCWDNPRRTPTSLQAPHPKRFSIFLCRTDNMATVCVRLQPLLPLLPEKSSDLKHAYFKFLKCWNIVIKVSAGVEEGGFSHNKLIGPYSLKVCV